MKLINGDCIEEMRKIKSGTINAVLCDMPYGTTQCKWDSVLDLSAVWEQVERIIADRGVVIFTAAQPFTSVLVCSNLKMFKYDLVWDKPSGTGFFNAKKMPLRNHESILIFYKKLPTYNPQMTHGHERKTATKRDVNSECYGRAIKITQYDSTSRYPRSIQRFSSDKQRTSLHPTQKPVALMEWLIATYTNEGDSVLDFCMGSGTTGVACKNLNRNFIGIELNEKYFDIAKSRIKNTNKEGE